MAEAFNRMNDAMPAIPSRDEILSQLSDIQASVTRDPAEETERNIRRLAQAIKNAGGRFALNFAVCNDRDEQRRLGREIGMKLPALPVEVVLDGTEPSLLDVLSTIPEAPRPLFVYGVEQLLPSGEEGVRRREATLHEFQHRREQFRGLGRPLLLWLPEYAYALIGQQAVDFWSWQSGGFFFVGRTAILSDRRAGLSNLPLLRSDFVRRPEMGPALQLLRRHHLLNITGAGGSGKTTLAIALAEEVKDEYPDGQLLIQAGTRQGQDSVAATLSQAIWLVDPEAALPDNLASLRSVYLHALGSRRWLLILDDATDEGVVQAMLPPADSALVVTSRVSFRESGLQVVRLGALSPAEARELLLSVVPGLDPSRADRIADRLEGNPWAIRLAGALLAESPRLDLTRGLESLFRRFYERLDADEARVLRLCSVFVDSFDGQAEEYVAGDSKNQYLLKLRDRALISSWALGDRFVMPEAVRKWAGSYMPADELFDAQLRHATHYLAVCERTSKALWRAGSQEGSQELWQLLDAEWENIKAGQAWAAVNYHKNDDAARLCSGYPLALVSILQLRLRPGEREQWLKAGSDAARLVNDPEAEAFNLYWLGTLHSEQLKLGQADEELTEVLRQARSAGRKDLETRTLSDLARLNLQANDLEKAERYAQLAVEAARAASDEAAEAYALVELAQTYTRMDRLSEALSLAIEGSRLAVRSGDPGRVADAYLTAGGLYQRSNDFSRALDNYRKAKEIIDEMGDPRRQMVVLRRVGEVELLAGQAGQSDSAERLISSGMDHLEQALRLARTEGLHADTAAILASLGQAYLATGDLRRAEDVSKQALELADESHDPNLTGAALANLGITTQQLGDYEGSARLLRQALALAEQTGNRRSEAVTLTLLAANNISMGQYDEAEQALARASQLAQALGDSRLAESVDRAAAELQSRTGRRAIS